MNHDEATVNSISLNASSQIEDKVTKEELADLKVQMRSDIPSIAKLARM
jgi:hypothetical protein